jgi:hypothetical protein
MSNELALKEFTELGTFEDYQKLDESSRRNLSGQGEQFGNVLTRLKITQNAEMEIEKNKNVSVTRGTWNVRVPVDDGFVLAFADRVIFRTYVRGYRYSVYDLDQNKGILLTSIFKNWGDAIIDDLGREFSAKVYKRKTLESHPQFEDRLQCLQLLYGTVTFENAKDIDDNDVTVVDLPCQWIAKGSAFMPVADALNELTDKKRDMVVWPLVLTTSREKKGGNTYFVPVVAFEKEVGFNSLHFATLKQMHETVNAENMQVYEIFVKKQSKNSSNDVADKLTDVSDLNLNNDPDDEIPL